jgi:hypothetical protein
MPLHDAIFKELAARLAESREQGRQLVLRALEQLDEDNVTHQFDLIQTLLTVFPEKTDAELQLLAEGYTAGVHGALERVRQAAATMDTRNTAAEIAVLLNQPHVRINKRSHLPPGTSQDH